MCGRLFGAEKRDVDGRSCLEGYRACTTDDGTLQQTLETAKAYMLLLQRQAFVASQINSVRFRELLTEVIEVFSKQFQKGGSDIDGGEEAQGPAMVLLEDLKGIITRRKRTLWDALGCLSPTKCF